MFRKTLLAFGLIGVMLMTSAPTYSVDGSVDMLTVLPDSPVVNLIDGCCAGCPATGPCKVDHKCYNGSCVDHQGANCSPSDGGQIVPP